jgi:hypothetical protein
MDVLDWEISALIRNGVCKSLGDVLDFCYDYRPSWLGFVFEHAASIDLFCRELWF